MNWTLIGLNWMVSLKCLEMTFVVIWRFIIKIELNSNWKLKNGVSQTNGTNHVGYIHLLYPVCGSEMNLNSDVSDRLSVLYAGKEQSVSQTMADKEDF